MAEEEEAGGEEVAETRAGLSIKAKRQSSTATRRMTTVGSSTAARRYIKHVTTLHFIFMIGPGLLLQPPQPQRENWTTQTVPQRRSPRLKMAPSNKVTHAQDVCL